MLHDRSTPGRLSARQRSRGMCGLRSRTLSAASSEPLTARLAVSRTRATESALRSGSTSSASSSASSIACLAAAWWWLRAWLFAGRDCSVRSEEGLSPGCSSWVSTTAAIFGPAGRRSPRGFVLQPTPRDRKPHQPTRVGPGRPLAVRRQRRDRDQRRAVRRPGTLRSCSRARTSPR